MIIINILEDSLSVFFLLCLFLVIGFYIVVWHCNTQNNSYSLFFLCKMNIYWKSMEVCPNFPRRGSNFAGNQSKNTVKIKEKNWTVITVRAFFACPMGRWCLCESLWTIRPQGIYWKGEPPRLVVTCSSSSLAAYSRRKWSKVGHVSSSVKRGLYNVLSHNCCKGNMKTWRKHSERCLGHHELSVNDSH